ncbi:hypothetical protein FALBO_6623 [Fusarium albosuccineum]|uniref:DUF899-domain-containing protein n=1 Tax=Fusarium albosuccineum TaxID=1237068 RepID=A0A8H4LCX9_9HYPO|nr:hypothetical protein FALBO_6623 [Fusarium albosuccineum]
MSNVSRKIVSRDEWLSARKAFLEKEKEHTRASDALAAERRNLPMVRVDKEYTFKGPGDTTHTLSDLFGDSDQLIVYHFMFKPEDNEGCRGCCHVGESLPDPRHLQHKSTSFACVSRASADKLDKFKKRAGWSWPWYSSGDSDFNYDFFATTDKSKGPDLLNFRTKDEVEAKGQKWWEGDVPGYSVFLKQDGEIYHTYSTFARGGETVLTTLMMLDMTPLGRNLDKYGPAEFKLKDEYASA